MSGFFGLWFPKKGLPARDARRGTVSRADCREQLQPLARALLDGKRAGANLAHDDLSHGGARVGPFQAKKNLATARFFRTTPNDA
jgi:hypothetical protein